MVALKTLGERRRSFPEVNFGGIMSKSKELATYPPLPEIGFVRMPIVLHVLGIKKTALYQGIKNGIFPAPKKLTSRTSVWAVEDLRNFINQVNDNNGNANIKEA